MSNTIAGAEGRGYNRGLILGFTMAESLLLVVFCLLLVAAAIISKERQRATEAEQRATRAEEQVLAKSHDAEELQKQIKEMQVQLAAAGRDQSDDEWRELVLAKKAVEALAVKFSDKNPKEIVRKVTDMLEDYRELQAAIPSQKRLQDEHLKALAEISRLRQDLDSKAKELASLEKPSKPHEWPPIITLSEANNNYFRSGSAELTVAFATKLNSSIADQIASNLQAYGADIVEVIGHTDEQPISRAGSNMDKNAIDVLLAHKNVTSLEPADNAGLGLARAISVANVLKSNKSLADITVLPLSAAQLILPGDTLTRGEAGDVETRRRIEIRIRRREVAAQ
ncbi:OmpA family protein [Ensifer adhaerens]|uniref:OmpA family protein n=1 Tax=Ensifer adhaerens TaxID=106592 RepID=UPI001CC0A742|nr:OmpA family protein [Ensifer adhaerens]MBZ7925005.1 OmpA family protein [Ensifer adhaerens]UAX95793.1 OmpA family protein [Ensifer adhaerens]UAY04866.1 OmpA family protein [Ensifer adhaerens]UAY10298.1 OmpA family protein [Ensifer adhaerens]